jgi:septal ring factor EnvC (AmiA/AmiB activator)
MRRTGLGLLIALVCLSPWPLSAIPPADELQRKEHELSELRAGIRRLRSDLDAAKSERDRLTRELARTEEAVGALARSAYELTARIERGQGRLEEMGHARGARQARLAAQRSALGAQVRAAHVTGRQERLKMLLNQEDPAVVSRMMVYYDYLNQDRIRSIRDIQRGMVELRELETQIHGQQRELQRLRSLQEDERQALEKSLEERESALAALEAGIRADDRRLSDMEQDEQRMETFLQELERLLLELPLQSAGDIAFTELRGQLPWPVSGRLSVAFGSPRKRGGRSWDGVVIGAKEGSEVRAIHHGRVVFADWLRGLGLLLIVDHGAGFMSLYGHNQSLFKETGEWVAPGEVIGLVGRSGGHTNAGVYFGIRKQGKPVNPGGWCKASQGDRVG